MKEQSYRVLLYYNFTKIDSPEQFTAEHLQYCKDLGVKGRILIASEGINGTLSGTIEQTDTYMADMLANPIFKDTVFKIDEVEEHTFKKLFVRHKEELVTFRYEHELDPNTQGGKHLSPTEFYEQMQDEDVVILDGRNDYEYEIGHFRGAIRPDVESFREFPQWIRDNMGQYKDKKILTYCTGGIRCEKLTAFMIHEGFSDVAQLDGGIVTYGKDPETQGRLFDGKCYVFDERISVPINRTDEDVVIASCHHCGVTHDRYINCPVCNLQYVCCEDCETEHEAFCSNECHDAVMPTANHG